MTKLQQIAEQLRVKAEFWRTTQNDPHGISTPVYVALKEVADAVKIIADEQPDHHED